jgi:tetratricopeptide (TPR) repeat protein
MQLYKINKFRNDKYAWTKRILIILLLFLNFNFSSATLNPTEFKDSLLKSATTANGTEKVNALNQLSEFTSSFSASTSRIYAEQALKLAGEIKYSLGMARSYGNIALIYLYRGENQRALTINERAIVIFRNEKEYESLYRSLLRQAGFYQLINNNTKVIETYFEAMNIATESGRFDQMATVSINLGLYFLTISDKVNAKYYISKALLYSKMSSLPGGIGLANCAMADYYSVVKQNQSAVDYYQRSIRILSNAGERGKMVTSYVHLGNHYVNNKEYDSAAIYYEKALELDKLTNNVIDQSNVYTSLAHVFQYWKQLNKALQYQKMALKLRQDFGHISLIGSSFTNIGTVYTLLKDYPKALYYYTLGLKIAQETHRTEYIKFNYQRIYELYFAQKNYQKALQFNLLIRTINDSILKSESQQKYAEFQYKYENEKKLQNINFLTKENEIQKLNLKQTRFTIYIMTATLVLLIIIGILLFYQSKLKAQHKHMELEQKLLRSQMNPHFIFNALIAIQSFIFNNESAQAAHYITSFARLIRLVLSNSREEFVTLQREIDTLSNYLSLQKIRFENKFDYNFLVDPLLETELIKIPPMLAQPFIENAIEQGIAGMGWPGKIIVSIRENEKNILIEVRDNRIGYSKSDTISEKLENSKESHVTRITEERIANLNRKYHRKIHLEITDIFDDKMKYSGTNVLLTIPELDI